MLLSKSCRYALRASIYLARKPAGTFVTTKLMCSDLNISFHYLIKILQILNRQSIIQSERGTKGGVRLARPSGDISLKEIILTIEGEDFFTRCVLGFPECGSPGECALHKEWKEVKCGLDKYFSETSLEVFSGEGRISGKQPEIIKNFFLTN